MINYLAVLAAAIAAFAVGALWYTALFGRVWRREMGVPEGAPTDGMAQSMIGGFVATLIMTWALAYLFMYFGVLTMHSGLMFAFWIWLGFVATILSNSIWYEKRSWTLYCINASHYLVAILLAAAVIIWIG